MNLALCLCDLWGDSMSVIFLHFRDCYFAFRSRLFYFAFFLPRIARVMFVGVIGVERVDVVDDEMVCI